MRRHWDRLAAVYGFEVFEASAAELDFIARQKGVCVTAERAIIIYAGLVGAERDRVLGHELGHLVLEHPPTRDVAVTASQEAEADAWRDRMEPFAKRTRSGCRPRGADSL